MLSLFGKKKIQPSPAENLTENQEPMVLSKLQEITAGDDEMYRSLFWVLFLFPQKNITSFGNAVCQATAFYKTGKRTRAGGWLRIAGGVALFPGGQERVG